MPFALDYVRARLRELDADIAGCIERTATGMPTNEAAYRELVGYIRGLREARRIFLEPFNARERGELPPPT